MIKAPFPWFGGKSRAADLVWRALGPDVSNYIEPFAGSLAVLLARPGGAGKIETVNDRGLHGTSAPPALGWFLELQERLRRVRVACGDWSRVLGDSVLGKGKNVGGRRPCAVFLDPPYAYDLRTADLYSVDDGSVSAAVRKWAIDHGDDPDLRIALCGYEGEHEMPDGWTAQTWKARRGYASDANENRKLERIWFSRHCLSVDSQLSLLGAR